MFILNIRNWFWHYPEYLFFGKTSLFGRIISLYYNGVPFTSGLLITVIIGLIFFGVVNGSRAMLTLNETVLIEGVVVGTDESTHLLNQLNKISPLTSDSNKSRLEKDLIELIYESLITVDQKGDPKPVLADFLEVEKGRKYQFKLKENIYWHDGKPITADDVVATFELLKTLENDPKTSTLYSKAAVQMDIQKLSDVKSFEFIAKGNNIIPGFFEAISFKILPAHLLKDITVDNINLPDPYINRNPVGSGVYKFLNMAEDSIELIKNSNYYGNKPTIDKIKFKFFPNERSAINALKTGQIHSLVGTMSNINEEFSSYKNLSIAKSNVLYNQYWAIYFNLSDSANIGLKELKVRQAISYAIDKQKIISEALEGHGEVADGPISKISFAYTSQYIHSYNIETAAKLLDGEGWKLAEGDDYRTKNGIKLSFNLVFLDSEEKSEIAQSIVDDLKMIGVEVLLTKQSPSEIKGTVISRTFDAIIYGTQTFIDPDRYELFHSSQIVDPGLNISSWSSAETTGKIVDGKKSQVAESDDVLEVARRIVNEDERKKLYKDFQRLVANEVPLIYLYYPVETYVYNKRLSNITLKNLNSIKQRFINVDEWRLEL
jgi:peptide/nickel transport system substrate-binding protein